MASDIDELLRKAGAICDPGPCPWDKPVQATPTLTPTPNDSWVKPLAIAGTAILAAYILYRITRR